MPTRLSVLMIALAMAGTALASGFDREAFERLDPTELRAAEARIHELLEPGTARLLREPANPAEAYVVQRQQRLARLMNERQPRQVHADNSATVQAFWPTARATRAMVNSHGAVELRCVDAAVMLGHQTPDFRLGNAPREVTR
jgi:hypothetical protein